MTPTSPPTVQQRETTFFLPDLCARESVLLLVIIAELFALVVVLAQPPRGAFDWSAFSLVSLFVQFVALTSAAILCGLRDWVRRLPERQGVLLVFLVIPMITWVAAILSEWLTATESFSSPLALLWDRGVLNRVAIGTIVSGLVLRQFYLQAQLMARRESELLHRVQALQSRIRPHFLFNSMNIIASLIEVDPKKAEAVVEDLASLFRASLNHVGNQVPLVEEIDLCKKFLHIEQLRLGRRLDVQWEIRTIPSGVQIPLLTLQPLLENAIMHGIQPRPEGGTVAITIGYSHGVVELMVINPCEASLPPAATGLGFAPTVFEGNRMALDNIRNRLQALYGERARLTGYREDNRYITRMSYPYPQGAN